MTVATLDKSENACEGAFAVLVDLCRSPLNQEDMACMDKIAALFRSAHLRGRYTWEGGTFSIEVHTTTRLLSVFLCSNIIIHLSPTDMFIFINFIYLLMSYVSFLLSMK